MSLLLPKKHSVPFGKLVPKPLEILVADDHYANRLLTQSLLQREGHQIALAEDGKDAIEACRHQIFDVILLDIQMPVLNGFQALRAIRALDNGNADTKIFALTAHNHTDEIRTILRHGFEAVLIKPFRVADMMRHLDRPYKPRLNRVYDDKDEIRGAVSLYDETLNMPLLENQTLDILLDAIGPERMCRVLTAYWADALVMMDALKSARLHSTAKADEELIALRKTAHGLKGASANIGLLRAARLSARAQNAPIEDIPFLIEKIEQTLEESKPAIRDYCGLNGAPMAPRP